MNETLPGTRRQNPPKRRGCLIAAGIALALLLAAGGLAWFVWDRAEDAALTAQEQAAKKAFDPLFEKMAAAEARGKVYDIDKTIRVIHETDRMLQDTKSLPEYLEWASKQDYTGVAPEVLEARREILKVVMSLYASQIAEEDQAELSRFSAETILQVASMVGVQGKAGVGISGSFSVDREQATRLLEQARKERVERERLRKAIREAESDMIEALVAYSGVYSKYLEQWDRLCVLRDKAYLAASTEEWGTVAAAATKAIALAPSEREAHLLLALALVEGGPDVLPEVDVQTLLSDYMEAHPDATAPAFLLLGAEQARQGRFKEAELSLMQSSAYYPRQAATLADLFNPYEARSYLRATREGRYVLHQYQSTMMGAGRFSPDLQLARIAFRTGNKELGRKKLMEHFFRRRAEQEWDFVLEDVRYCLEEFGVEFSAIFPPESYLDLISKPSMMGLSDNLSLSIRNRSDITLHNATLLLCVHFTDMYPDDYEVIVGGETRPAVNAHEETSFGEVAVEVDVLGKKRRRSDIVRVRAILVTDEAVTWVDTEEYRVAEAREFRDNTASKADKVPAKVVPGILDKLGRDSTIKVERSRFGKDDVVIGLPRELVMLSPLFDLKVGDLTIKPDLNDLALDDGRIRLEFKNALSIPEGGEPPVLTLVARTPWGRELKIRWEPTGPEGYGKPRLEDLAVRPPVPGAH